MSDGSVDAATIEGEIVYSKFVVKGKVYMHFVGIQAVERPNAAGIKGAICDVLKMSLGVDDETLAKKLVSIVWDVWCFCYDGKIQWCCSTTER